MTEVLRVDQVARHFQLPSAWGGGGERQKLVALDGVSLTLSKGETLGVIGESGSGKSTLARLALGLDRPTSGTVRFDGTDLSALSAPAWRAMRRRAQYIFQDTSGSLNPRLRVGEQIREGLDIHRIGTPAERRALVFATLEAVGLDPALAERFPHQLSGGQQQRVVIARAIILKPDLLVADEPVSALDLSVQAQVVMLLATLQRETSTAMLLISHDLKVVRRTTARLMVLYLGRVVEEGDTAAIFAQARHPYTNALLGAMLPSKPAASPARRFRIAGDPPSPIDIPQGCALEPRCPFAVAVCRTSRPPLAAFGADHKVACHRAAEIPGLVAGTTQTARATPPARLPHKESENA